MASLIPWTITNKYYTADVHFLIDNVSESDSGGSKFPPVQEDEKIPAIIFAFAKDEVSVMSDKPAHMPINPVAIPFPILGSP